MNQPSSNLNFGISSDIMSLQEYLKLAQDHDLQIPAFQRQYEWSEESVTRLFNDIIEFSKSTTDTYFIGQVITRLGPNNACEIVDGQQRTISIFLWLKAIYQHLDKIKPTEPPAVKDCQDKIASILWNTSDKDMSNWTPRVSYPSLGENIDDEHSNKRALKTILSPSFTQSVALDDTFSVNYEILSKLIKQEFPLDNTDQNKLIKFVDTLLNKVLLQHTQVTSAPLSFKIFETLNTRGLALDEADILKVRIYNSLKDTGEYTKDDFINAWQSLEVNLKTLYDDSNMRWLFDYYMDIVVAEQGITSPEAVSNFSKFWEGEGCDYLTKPDLIPNLCKILYFCYLMDHEKIDWEKLQGCDDLKVLDSSESWLNDSKTRQLLHILSLCQQGWTISAICYWWFHRKDKTFQDDFKQYLRNLVAECCSFVMLKETYKTIDFLKLNAAVVNQTASKTLFSNFKLNKLNFAEATKGDNSFLYTQHQAKVLLTLLNYQKTDSLLYSGSDNESESESKIEVEHIVSRKWNNSYTSPELEEYIDHIGNKTLINKCTNIKVSDKPVIVKIEQYNNLPKKFKITKDVAYKLANNNGDAKSLIAFIKQRDRDIIEDLCVLLNGEQIKN